MKPFDLVYNYVDHQLEYPNGDVFAVLTGRVTSGEAFEIVALTQKDRLVNIYRTAYRQGFEDGEEHNKYDDDVDLKDL